MTILLLTETDLRRCAGFDPAALAAVADAFAAHAAGETVVPPVMHLAAPLGDVDVKGAYMAGRPGIAIKVASGFFGNGALGLPNSTAMVVLLSATTGRCETVMLDNGYLTDLRTGLAGAVAARHLAPAGRLRVGMIGAGAQARFQLEALTIEDRVASVAVFARRQEQCEAYAADMSDRLGLPVTLEQSARAVVEGCDLLVTTTSSRSPIVEADWLHPGQHVTAVGSDLPGKRELALGVLRRAGRLVVDDLSQSRAIGELQSVPDGDVLLGAASLGDVVAGRAPGRRSADEISICDLTGVGVQDTAIALHALERARAAGLGFAID